jgi:hypothetical protein
LASLNYALISYKKTDKYVLKQLLRHQKR